jgi:acyl-CoA-binding protein
MGDQKELFEQAVKAAKQLENRPDNDTLLKLYSLYKQATEEDVSGEKPGFFDFIAVAKYEAWEKLAGMTKNDAREAYIELVRELGGAV